MALDHLGTIAARLRTARVTQKASEEPLLALEEVKSSAYRQFFVSEETSTDYNTVEPWPTREANSSPRGSFDSSCQAVF
jgi:hypothetical protein